MAYGTINADQIGTSVANTSLGAGNASIMKNRIINGAMVIDQRNAGASVTPTDGSYSLDRYYWRVSQSSKLTTQQSSTAPTGFVNSMLVTSSSAYSIGSSDFFTVMQRIEGFNIADLGWGTASAKTVTLSFWVQSSLTGTFGGAFSNGSFNRSYPFTYTISSANTWTQIIITIAGDTSGTWATTNSTGIQVSFGLGVGSSFSGTAGSWQGISAWSATGATSVVGTSGATFYITGVQLEVGSSATGFEYRQYGTELGLCQRYYEIGGADQIWSGYVVSGTSYYQSLIFEVPKRSSATMTYTSSANSNFPATAPNYFTSSSPNSAQISKTANGTGNMGYYQYSWTASAEL